MVPKTVRIPTQGVPRDGDITTRVIDCDLNKCEHGDPLSSCDTVSCIALLGHSMSSTGPEGFEHMQSRCIMCYLPGIIRCDDCRVARYCSLECLDGDRKIHAPLCASFRHEMNGFKDSDRPTAQHVRILALPPTGIKGPVFGWARRVKTDMGIWALESDDPDIVAWHTKNPNNHTKDLVNMGLGFPPLGHGLHVHWMPLDIKNDRLDASSRPFNRAIASLAPPGQLRAQGVQVKYGIVFAMTMDGGGGLTKTIRDVTFRDARSLVDYLLQGDGYSIVLDSFRFIAFHPSAIIIPAIKTNSPSELSSVVAGITQDQSIEELSVVLRQPADYRPIFAACRLGLRYWTRLAPKEELAVTRIVSSPGFHMYGGEFAHNLEVHRSASGSPGPFTYVNTERNVTSNILLHGSGEKIEKTHFLAVVNFLREGQLREDAINGGKKHEWPGWVVKALGPDHNAKLKDGKLDKEAFRGYWDIWKVHVGRPDMESPWDFEERHKHRAIFMSSDGTWPSMGVATSDHCRDCLSAFILDAKQYHAEAVGHVNHVRAAEMKTSVKAYFQVSSKPTDESRWMEDLGRTSMNDLVGRLKTVCPYGPLRPECRPSQNNILDLDPQPEGNHRPSVTATPINVDYMPHAAEAPTGP